MPKLDGTKTHTNLKEAFAGESQANRRYKAEKSHAGRFDRVSKELAD
jgi:rubrerythrin